MIVLYAVAGGPWAVRPHPSGEPGLRQFVSLKDGEVAEGLTAQLCAQVLRSRPEYVVTAITPA